MERKDALAAVDLAKLPFGLRVRAARKAAGLSQAELAEKLETTKATVSKLETSNIAATLEWVERLANALDVSVGALSGFGVPSPAATRSLATVPVIGMIAAGNWREAIQTSDERIAVPDAKPYMFALRISGDSIDRVAPDGSYVTIDPTLPALEDGGLYAVQNGEGEATIKRFRRHPDRLEPESSNPSHKAIMLGGEPITVIGRATSITFRV